MRHLIRWITLTIILTCWMLLLAACDFGGNEEEPPTITLPTPMAATADRQMYTVARGAVVEQVVYPGRATLADQRELYFGTTGRIEEVLVNSGDAVISGTVLARLRTQDLDLELERAVIAQELATQRIENAQTALELQRLDREYDLQAAKLRQEQVQAQRNPDPVTLLLQDIAVRQAELALQQLDNGVDPSLDAERLRAEIDLRRLSAARADAQVTAPIDGQVLFFENLQRGQLIQPFAPVATIADPRALVVEANLVPADLIRLSEGMAVQLRIGGEADQLVDGVIRRLPQPYGSGVRTVTEVELANPQDAALLNPGATIEIVAELNRADNALWLPPAAIQGFRDNYFVRLADGAEAPVQVGIYGTERVEIQGGVGEGQQVFGR